MKDISNTILLTGATGYVGGRLLGRLVAKKCRVRCLVRRPEEFLKRIDPEVRDSIEVCGGDVFAPETLARAFEGVSQAYYLIHSMGGEGSFEARDRIAAENFAKQAEISKVKRIIYLGGLGSEDEKLSSHLRSRQEVGEVLRKFSVPVIEFRASIIIGSGSLSFEMVRSLVERLPVMITPKWVASKAQPIAIADILSYLEAALSLKRSDSAIYEIGGADVKSYSEMMEEYAKQRNLRRLLIPVPLLTPRLSSLWLALITPLYARIGRKLVDSLKCSTTVKDPTALKDFSIRPVGIENAIRQALVKEQRDFCESHWADAFSSAEDQKKWGGVRFGPKLVDSRTVLVACSRQNAFHVIQRIGGDEGWYFGNFLWRIRGGIDRLVGGVGLRRGRRDATALRVGDALDWWRVETFEPANLLRLRAEMKLPGRAWLEFEVSEEGEQTRIRQTAIFEPRGLWGIAYWYGIYPLHQIIFVGMLRTIAKKATSLTPQ